MTNMKSQAQLSRHQQSVERCGCRYLVAKKTYNTDLFNNETTTKISPLPLYCKSYFCNSCANVKRQKYRARIKKNLSNKSWRFLTLTTVNANGNTVANMTKINQDWNKLNTLLKKKFGRFSYVKSLEVGKNGMVHLHILIDIFLPIRFIRVYWKKYCGAFMIDISKVKSHKQCLNYVTKYISKSSDDEAINSLFYLLNRRRITFSRDIKYERILDANYKLITDHVFRNKELEQFLIDYVVTTSIHYNDFDFSNLPPPDRKYYSSDFKNNLSSFYN